MSRIYPHFFFFSVSEAHRTESHIFLAKKKCQIA